MPKLIGTFFFFTLFFECIVMRVISPEDCLGLGVHFIRPDCRNIGLSRGVLFYTEHFKHLQSAPSAHDRLRSISIAKL